MAKTATDIRSLARSHTASAIRTLAGIMNEKKAPAAARVSAAEALLSRGWGRAPQTLDVNFTRVASQIADDELAHIALGGGDGVAETPENPGVTH